jgi:hypothetical protein
MRLRCCFVLLASLLTGAAQANPSPFDLAGPTLEAKVNRGGITLPASEVPNLAPGDKLWIKADLPPTQSANYLLIVAFLRGTTNPPPDEWFIRCKTWKEPCGRDGINVTVPAEAQQVMLFLAPETNGDFSTLIDAVKGRPGAFVRASQDLNQAALDRSRLDLYVSSVHRLDVTDPYNLKTIAPLLARSLAIKVEDKCLDRIPELQASCLMQGQENLILNDGHSTSIVQALTSGPASDLLLQASSTPQLGYGYYSPYIASVVDIARILDNFRTAQYQYIPALASQDGDRLVLTLNTAPSFNNPKSVLVAALPAVEKPQLPPLHAVDPKEIYCASRTSLILPVEGAPLVFSTAYAHNLTLNLSGSDGRSIALPARADAQQGGFVVDTAVLQSAKLGETIQASLRGYWGFEPYQGPMFRLRNAHAKSWALASGDADALVVGKQQTVHLQADSVSCVDAIMFKDPAGKELKAEWKPVNQNEVEVTLPLQEATPGAMTLLVTQYGASQPEPIPLQAFASAGRFDSFTVHAGDTQGLLKGSSLDEVASLSIGKLLFLPSPTPSAHGGLLMVAQDTQAATALTPNPALAATVTLKDGRIYKLNAAVDAARPRVSLIGKNVQGSQSSGDSNIQLGNQDELPQDAQLTFSLRAQSPASFSRDQSIEVATADESFSTSLTLGNGGLRLVDGKVAVATVDPAKAFGASAFGPLQFRVLADGVAGDWQPLATLVRLPVLKELKCPAAVDQPCKLSGADLFLVDSVAGDAKFSHPVPVPDGFPGTVLVVPRPAEGRLYVKLRDDPAVVNTAALMVQQLPPPMASTAPDAAPPAQNPTAPAVAAPPSPAVTPASDTSQQPGHTPQGASPAAGQAGSAS